jgi:DNA-binding response OmpR family regulator
MKERILVVDDEEMVREVIRLTLERRDYLVALASDGREALDFIAGNRPDLVITDIAMPEVDGYQLLEALRKGPETRTLPVILLTGKDSTTDVISGWSSGADYYVTKPFTSEVLLLSVEHVLAPTRKAVPAP